MLMFPTISPTYFARGGVQVERRYHCTNSGLHVWRYFLVDDNGKTPRQPFARVLHNPVGGFFTSTVRIPTRGSAYARASYECFDAAEEFALDAAAQLESYMRSIGYEVHSYIGFLRRRNRPH